MKKSNIEILISALRILAKDIKSEDGVTNACMAEGASRLEELVKYQEFYSSVSCLIVEGGEFLTKTELYENIKSEWEKIKEGRC